MANHPTITSIQKMDPEHGPLEQTLRRCWNKPREIRWEQTNSVKNWRFQTWLDYCPFHINGIYNDIFHPSH